jgi:hypothetical protein
MVECDLRNRLHPEGFLGSRHFFVHSGQRASEAGLHLRAQLGICVLLLYHQREQESGWICADRPYEKSADTRIPEEAVKRKDQGLTASAYGVAPFTGYLVSNASSR